MVNVMEAAMAESVMLACLDCGQRNRVPGDRLAGAKCGTCGAKLVTGKVAEIDPKGLDAALKDGLPLVVDFWAPWCGPCRQMAPEFAKAAAEMQSRVRFAKIDTERLPQLSARFAIRGIPLLILFEGGRERGRLAGLRLATGITGFLRESLPAVA
jgi:thioredoxin 2